MKPSSFQFKRISLTLGHLRKRLQTTETILLTFQTLPPPTLLTYSQCSFGFSSYNNFEAAILKPNSLFIKNHFELNQIEQKLAETWICCQLTGVTRVERWVVWAIEYFFCGGSPHAANSNDDGCVFNAFLPPVDTLYWFPRDFIHNYSSHFRHELHAAATSWQYPVPSNCFQFTHSTNRQIWSRRKLLFSPYDFHRASTRYGHVAA